MKIAIIVYMVVAAATNYAVAQVEASQNAVTESHASFDVEAISFASAGTRLSRLDIYAAIPYELLSFVKSEDRFAASYELTVGVFDSANSLVNEKLSTEEVRVPKFEQSVASGSFSLVQRSVELAPGSYKISVTCRDLESRVTRRVARQIIIPDYSKPGMQLSDIMIVTRMSMNGDKRKITPSISGNVGNIAGPMHIFFEAYNVVKQDSMKFVSTIFTEQNQAAMRVETTAVVMPGRNQLFLGIDQSQLVIGDYKLYVQVYASGDTGNSVATTSRAFSVRWNALPRSVKSLDLAIEELRYIAKDKELDYIKAGTSPEEKQKRFMEFWKSKDPNPNTPRNEKMERYYARVEYANQHFRHYVDGWRTDMGMVYIRFGPPSNVDRHPFDSDSKPYEIWSYYKLNHNFVFVDQTGFGDYRLTQPTFDVWQRGYDGEDDGL